MTISVIKPGFLVSLKTSLRGGVSYTRTDIEGDHIDDTGKRVAEWQTRRAIHDPEEFNKATEARSAARSAVSSVCNASSFGLLCPMDKENELTDAIAAARQIARAHNGDAKRTYVDVFVLVGRIAQDDAEAARAIGAEVRALLADMEAGIRAADPERIRDAASKARAIGGMLSDDVASKVTDAIAEARRAAREIVRRVEKAGETAATVVRDLYTSKIEAARFAFLDMEEGEATPEAPAVAGLDLPPAGEIELQAAPPLSQFAMEF